MDGGYRYISQMGETFYQGIYNIYNKIFVGFSNVIPRKQGHIKVDNNFVPE